MGAEGRQTTESSLIQIDKYIYTMKCWSSQINYFRGCADIYEGIDRKTDADFRVFWGNMFEPNSQGIIIETGFFWEAAHIDTCGLYQHSSLNTPQALKEIEEFNAPVAANDYILKQSEQSKFSQGKCAEWKRIDEQYDGLDWNGIVLASQNPTDRSIRSVDSPESYYRFYEDACKYYGKNLFIKLHPWNSGKVGNRLREIASKYGVLCAKTDHRILRNCEFVIVFNSTFTVDCIIRGIPVAQYAPGYFYQNPSVQYTCYNFPVTVNTDLEYGYKTADFLFWRYCFDYTMSGEDWIEMFNGIIGNRSMFPLPEEYSYAASKMRTRQVSVDI